MGDGQLRQFLHGIGVIDHRLQQLARGRRQVLHVVPFAFISCITRWMEPKTSR